MPKIVLIPGVLLSATLCSCQLAAPQATAISDAQRLEEYDRQMAKVAEQQAIADRQIEHAEAQQKRMEALLTRWEKQADRYDAILSRWEKQGAPAGGR